jgi:hypothetical protein
MMNSINAVCEMKVTIEYTQTVQYSTVQYSTALLNIAKHVKINQCKKYLKLTD